MVGAKKFNISLNDKLSNDSIAKELLNESIISFVQEAHSALTLRHGQLMANRHKKQSHYDQGKYPEYPDKDTDVSKGEWSVSQVPENLLDRRVELCVPSCDKNEVQKIYDAKESKVSSFIFDFEDTVIPSAEHLIEGYKNLYEVVNSLDDGQINSLPNIMARVRNLHLEDTILSDKANSRLIGAICDVGFIVSTLGKRMYDLGRNVSFYIPKIEESLEASWWCDLFTLAEKHFELPQSFCKVTYLIETLPAAYHVEEIIYNSKSRIIGLNVGKWDRIFSDIKVFRERSERIVQDRFSISMNQFWMDGYARRVIKICHDRGLLAIGGLANHVPDVSEKYREVQVRRFQQEKRYEYQIGHDGTWVSDLYFSAISHDIFKKKNQLTNKLENVAKYPDLIASCSGAPKSLHCLKKNIVFCMKYISSWLNGSATLLLENRLEDLSSLEISRAQIWQWRRHKILLDEGEVVDDNLLNSCLEEAFEGCHREIQSSISSKEIMLKQEEILKESFEITKKLINCPVMPDYFTEFIEIK